MAIPSTYSDSYDAVLTASSRLFLGRLRDNIVKGMKLLAYLESKGKIHEVDGGFQVQIPLMYALNKTADIMSGYGIVDTTPQDGMTTALFDWTQMATSITISKKEKIQNSGDKKFDLLKAKIMQAEKSLRYLFSRALIQGRIAASTNLGQFYQIVGRKDNNAVGPLPIPALVDSVPARSVAIGNINGNTSAWWRNKATSSTATTYAGIRKELYKMYNDVSRGDGGESPDLILASQGVFEAYHNSLQTQERYVDTKTANLLNGQENLKVKGATMIWDELVPDTETDAVIDSDGEGTALGTYTAGSAFFLNTEFWEIVVAKSANFSMSPFVSPENQVGVSTSIIDWMGAATVSNRRKQGVLYGIDETIAA